MKLYAYVLVSILGMATQIQAMEDEPTLLERVNVIKTDTIKNPHVRVAVVDSGFDTEHSLLKMQLSTGYNGRDNNTNVDCSTAIETNVLTSHGTHVAGIVAQIAPKARIVPYKFGAEGKVNVLGMLRNYEEIAKRKDIQIVNMSQHVYEYTTYPILYKAIVDIAKSGKLIVMAAGNHEERYGITPKTDKIVQLARDPDVKGRVIIVSASETILGNEFITHFSGRGQDAHDYFVTAPGYQINSSVPTNQYAYKSGTSMAAPVVSAVLAQIMAQTNCTIDEARQFLFDGCVNTIGERTLDKETYGHGIVNLGNSIQSAIDKKKKEDEAMMVQIRAAAKELQHQAESILRDLDAQEKAAAKQNALKKVNVQHQRKAGQELIHNFRQDQVRNKIVTPLPDVKKGNVRNLINRFQS